MHGVGSGAHGGFAAGSRHALFREGGRWLWHLVPVRFACGFVRSRGGFWPLVAAALVRGAGPPSSRLSAATVAQGWGAVTARAQAPSPWMVSHLPGVCCPAPARAQAFACVWWCGCFLPWRCWAVGGCVRARRCLLLGVPGVPLALGLHRWRHAVVRSASCRCGALPAGAAVSWARLPAPAGGWWRLCVAAGEWLRGARPMP